MRQINFAVAAGCIVGATGLLLALASGAEKPAAEKPASEKIIYSFAGGSDGANPQSDLILDGAGNLYGTTYYGGSTTACNAFGCGTVFELKRTQQGWKEAILHVFIGGADGESPSAGLVFDGAGNLYGATGTTVFRLTRNSQGSWTEHVIYTFDCNGSAGCDPTADLTFDSKGNLYGTTSQGGNSSCGDFIGCGGVFELTPQSDGSWTETTIHTFTGGTDGGQPSSGVVLDSEGNVYGMTYSGGMGKCLLTAFYTGCGILFEFSRNSGGSWNETVLFSFARGGGYAVNPSAGLILNNPGDLYATSLAGGDGFGTVLEFKEAATGWQQNVIHRFYGIPDGLRPVGKLEVDQDALLGVTVNGGILDTYGIAFELQRSETGSWKERILHSFAGGTADGYNPQAGMVSNGQGSLFGTTQYGGTGTACRAGTCGTVYEITP
jgi:hypothetical protein